MATSQWRSEFVPTAARREPDAAHLAQLRSISNIRPRIVSAQVRGPICIRLGETYDLKVEVRGIPTPTVTFFEGRRELTESPDYFTIQRKRYLHTLTVVRAAYDLNDLDLHVVAQNEAGSDRVKLDVKVYRVLPGDSEVKQRERSQTWRAPESVLVSRRRKVRVIRRGQSLCSIGSVNSNPSKSHYLSELSSSTASGLFHQDNGIEDEDVVFETEHNTSYSTAHKDKKGDDEDEEKFHEVPDIVQLKSSPVTSRRRPGDKQHTFSRDTHVPDFRFSSTDNVFQEVSSERVPPVEFKTFPTRTTKVRFASEPSLKYSEDSGPILRRPRGRRSRSAPGRRPHSSTHNSIEQYTSIEETAIIQGKAKSMETLQPITEVKHRKKRPKSGSRSEGQPTSTASQEISAAAMDVDLSTVASYDAAGASAPSTGEVKRKKKKKSSDGNILDMSVASAPEGMVYPASVDTSPAVAQPADTDTPRSRKKRSKSRETNIDTTTTEQTVMDTTEHSGAAGVSDYAADRDDPTGHKMRKMRKSRSKSSENSPTHRGHSHRHHGHEWFNTEYTTQQPEMTFYGFIDGDASTGVEQSPNAEASAVQSPSAHVIDDTDRLGGAGETTNYVMDDTSPRGPQAEGSQSSSPDDKSAKEKKDKKKKKKDSARSSTNTTLDDDLMDVSLDQYLQMPTETDRSATFPADGRPPVYPSGNRTPRAEKVKKKRSKSSDSLSSMTKSDKVELHEQIVSSSPEVPVTSIDSNTPETPTTKTKKKRSKSRESLRSLSKSEKIESHEQMASSSAEPETNVMENQTTKIKKSRSKSRESLRSLTKSERLNSLEQMTSSSPESEALIKDANPETETTKPKKKKVPTATLR